MGKTWKNWMKADSVRIRMQRKYGGSFVVRKIYGRYIVKRPNFKR